MGAAQSSDYAGTVDARPAQTELSAGSLVTLQNTMETLTRNAQAAVDLANSVAQVVGYTNDIARAMIDGGDITDRVNALNTFIWMNTIAPTVIATWDLFYKKPDLQGFLLFCSTLLDEMPKKRFAGGSKTGIFYRLAAPVE